MGLSELAAFETAYQALQPLSLASRRRALTWLTDALAEDKPLVQAPESSGGPGQTIAAPRKERKAAIVKAAEEQSTNRRGRGRKVKVPVARSGTRTYRRMPEAAEVMGAYRQAGSINSLAEHFDVPVHTVYSWARRLRQQGYQIGR